jgi:GDP/UDP-N,N'-diacetylbacillosamine 2-epimerase (hydrolysing)
MKRKICVITGSRADYGLLKWLMQEITWDPSLELQIVATGMHLSETFGETYKEIELDGFVINRKVETLESGDSHIEIASAISSGIIGCTLAFDSLKPDLLIVLGDRFEIFAATTAALVSRIPIAHIHGGEVTLGAFDEALRHSITKMSHLHFAAAAEYCRRIIQLGEDPSRVFNVGGLGLDAISKVNLLTRPELNQKRGIVFSKRNLLVTFHPVTLEDHTAEAQIDALLSALKELPETTLIITLPNADTGGLVIISKIKKFAETKSDAYVFDSLGQIDYLSCVNEVDGVIGNSSSGLTEVPIFKKGTINIGERQTGRLMARSVINCDPNEASISLAISRLYTEDFQASLSETISPYGTAGASKRIVNIIKTIKLDGILKKDFNDL